MGPFRGIRALDLSRIVAGPLATRILADMGCDVVKVERPGTGGDTRAWVPPHALGEGRETGTFFQSVNRGKRSVTIDLACPAGADLVARLAGRADVLLENHRVVSLVRYGLDSRTLSSRNPGLVYCLITGYGQAGPYAGLPGHDPIVQACGRMMHVTGSPGAEPVRCGVAVVDELTGVYAATAVGGALYHRHRTGRGQFHRPRASRRPDGCHGQCCTGVVKRRRRDAAHGERAPQRLAFPGVPGPGWPDDADRWQ